MADIDHHYRDACLASARNLRDCAQLLRRTAGYVSTSEERRMDLTREADAADRQADRWIDAAEEG